MKISKDGRLETSTSASDVKELADIIGKSFEPAEIIDPITKIPDFFGSHGKAWLCDTVALRNNLKVKPEDDATICQWVVEAPGYHPIWHSYTIISVHLRPMPDKRETIMYLPDATHEMWVFALNPEKATRNQMIEGSVKALGKSFLTPKNFGAQYIELDDDLARHRIRQTVKDVCDGLSPDVDNMMAWRRLFGSNMVKDEYK